MNAARAGLVVGWCPPPVFFFLLPGKAGAHAPAPAPPPPPPSKRTLLGHLLHHGVGLDGKALEGAAGGREEGEGQACVCEEEEERLDGRAAGGAPPPPLGRAAVVALLRRHTHAHAHAVRGHAHALCAEPRRQIKNRRSGASPLAFSFDRGQSAPAPLVRRLSSSPPPPHLLARPLTRTSFSRWFMTREKKDMVGVRGVCGAQGRWQWRAGTARGEESSRKVLVCASLSAARPLYIALRSQPPSLFFSLTAKKNG